MSDKIPIRPNTPPDEAMEAQERLLHFLLVEVAVASGDPVGFLAKARIGVTDGMAEIASQNESQRRVADHMDWALALAELQMRQTYG